MIALNAMIGDCFHEGHQNLLRKMREQYPYVVVVIHDDISCYKIKGKFPIQSIERRVWQLENSGLVDRVIVSRETDPAKEFEMVINEYKDVAYFRGDDMKDNFPGKWMLDKYQIPINFIEYTKGVSSTQIRKDISV